MTLKKKQASTSTSGATEIIKETALHDRESYVQLMKSNSSWDNLNISSRLKDSLKRFTNETKEQRPLRGNRNEHKWLTCLFTGSNGTGKTMAAQVIANELNLDLYRIDFSSVVSKYIGETEKNLARLFEVAENKNWILFFDEADALFGKRTDVKDSHDRYANIEVSYLLQLMEGYPGVVILSTSKKSNIDSGFTRRLRYVLNFPKPIIKQKLLQPFIFRFKEF